jgi:hypothetical protein
VAAAEEWEESEAVEQEGDHRFSAIRSALDVNHAAIALPAHQIMPNPLLSLTLTGVLHGSGHKERLDRVLAPYNHYAEPMSNGLSTRLTTQLGLR